MAAGMPELGSRISLISKADIRYEGKLFTVDPHECTIALSEVRSFGTEDRETSFPVPVQSQIYDFILFRGSDIKDIRVLSTTIPNDPAIVQLSVPPTLTGTQHIGGYPANGSRTKNFANLLMSSQHPQQLQQVNQHPVQNHMQSPLQNQAGPSCGYPNQPMYPYNAAANIGPVPVINSGFNVVVPLEVQGLPNQQPKQVAPYVESDISTTNATANTKEAEKDDSSDSSECADVSQQRPNLEEEAGTKPINKFPQENRWSTQQRERQNYVRRSSQQQQGTHSGYNRDANHTAERSTGGGYRQTNSYSGEHAGYRNNNYAERGNYRQTGYGDRNFRNDGYHQGYSTARQSAGPSGAASWSGYARAPRRGGTGVPRAGHRQQGSQSGRQRQSAFEGEYDFETANSEFEELKSQLSKIKIDDGLNDGENEKKEEAEEAAADNNNEEKDDKGVPKKFYDKKKSFFDQISCEAIERSKGNVTRVDWRNEYRLNSETFGLSPYRQQYDYRGNYGHHHHHQSSGYRGGYYYKGGNYMNRYHRGGGHRRQHTANAEGGASYNQQVAVSDASKD